MVHEPSGDDVIFGELQTWKPKLEDELADLEVGEWIIFHLSNGAQVTGAFVEAGPGFAVIRDRQAGKRYLVQLDHVAVLETS